MAYRRILTVQDISCLGQCSGTVALPILSACGQEACILPTAVLSTHTGGFGAVTKRDLTEDFSGILAHWKREKLDFDAVYTGYLGGKEQIAWVRNIFDSMVAPGGVRIVDPAMADHGKLYKSFDDAFVEEMRSLCAEADVIIPNVTEGGMLAEIPYQEEPDREFVKTLLEKLGKICPRVVLTGVGEKPGKTGAAVYWEGEVWQYSHPKGEKSYHGTGDMFAAAFVGAWQQGKTPREAVKIAADFTALAIGKTKENPAHWYGVKFETALPELVQMVFGRDM